MQITSGTFYDESQPVPTRLVASQGMVSNTRPMTIICKIEGHRHTLAVGV
jgi:hypothetical protein